MTKKLLFFYIFLHSFLINANARQGNYRWRNDDGNQTAATWKAATNSTTLVGTINQPLRLRMEVYNSSSSGSYSFNLSPLQYRKNGGSWISITSSTANDFYFINSAFVTNNTGTSQQISTGSFTGGFFKSDNSNNNISLSTTTRTEIEFCFARSSNYDIYATYEFQIASLTSYDRYPTLNPICSTSRPTVTSNIVYNLNQVAFPLTATGTNLMWYTVPTGGTGSSIAPTPLTNTVGTTSYYVSQNTGCEGPRSEIKVIVRPTTSTGKSLHFDGVNDYVKVSSFDFATSNNFTIDLWVKPEKTITLPTEATAGITGSTGQSYPLFPTLAGAYGVPDATHAGAGVSVGTNGICVFEHAGGYLPALLVHPVTISDWTRVTVVYTNKQPSLYINGVLARTGLTSTRSFIHPPLRDIGSSDNGSHNTYGPFQGSIDRIYILNNSVIPNTTCEPNPNDSNVIASYFFDQGIAGADNSTINYLIDNGERYSGDLLNFTLNGGTSNWLADTPSMVLPTPPVAADQIFCSSATVANLLPAPSATINWYSQAIGGTALTSTTALSTGFYYVDYTDANGCKSARTKIAVRQSNNIAPVVTSPVIYNQGDTASALTATGSGTGLLLYTTSTGGTGSTTAPTPSTATVGTTSYWVTSTNANGCESARVEIVVNVNTPIPATHINFDGVNDLISSTSTGFPIGNSARTIEAWVKTTQNTTGGAIMTYGNLTNNNRFALYQSSGKLNFVAENNDYNTNVTLNDGVWHHVAATHDGTNLKIYLDGVQVGTTQIKTFNTTGTQFSIGYRGVSGLEHFNGSIDEVRVWNVARTAEQIAGSMNCELQGNETGLVAYYKMNQGNDQANNAGVTTLTNSVSGGPNGTLTNFALTGSTSNWLAGSPVTTGSVVPGNPTVTTPVSYNQGDTATALSATTGTNGTGLLWYTTATGGTGSTTAPTPSTTTVGSTSYWVTSTNANGCESTRVEIVVTVNTPIPATHLNFDGTNDYVVIPTINITSDYTIEAWIKTTANGKILAGYDSVNHYDNFLSIDYGGNLTFQIDDYNTSAAYGIYSSQNLTDNNWHHVAVTKLSTSYTIYVDGVNAGTFTTPTNYIGNFQTIGQHFGGFFNGEIDEIRIWNSVQTDEQIAGSMNCELQGNETGLVAYYKMNQGNDQANNAGVTTLTNSVSGGPNGTLTNFALTGSTSNWLAGSPVTTGSVVPGNPTVTTPVSYNQGDSASALTATTGANGTGLLWYTNATGGTGSTTAPTPSTATAGSTSYWVASTNPSGCESTRSQIVVIVNSTTPATHLNFDGVNDGVNLGNSLTTALNGANFVTAEAWIYIPNTTGIKTIIGNHVTTTQFNLRINNNSLEAFLGFGSYALQSPAGSIVANTWQHVTMVYNDTTLKLYINGVEVASRAIPAAYALQSSTQPYMVGYSGFGGEFFNGSIDEVRVWNTALSETDIQVTKDCELQATQNGILAYYKFNQGFDNADNAPVTTLTDELGSYNGTLNNFSLTGTTSNWAAGSPVTTGNSCNTLSNSGFETISNFKVYPNPSNGLYNISTTELTSIQIYDVVGKLIMNNEVNAGTSTINIHNFPAGVYILRYSGKENNTNGTIKLIKN